MSKKEISNFIGHIETLCPSKMIVDHCRMLINQFNDSVLEVKDDELRAIKDGESLDVSISPNYFTIYSTNWGTTERERINFLVIDNQLLLSINKDIVSNDESFREYFIYQFCGNQLVKANYIKKKNFKNKSKDERIITEDKQEVIFLGDDIALVSQDIDGKKEYYQANIGDFNIEKVNLIYFINGHDNKSITEEEYKKRVKVMV